LYIRWHEPGPRFMKGAWLVGEKLVNMDLALRGKIFFKMWTLIFFSLMMGGKLNCKLNEGEIELVKSEERYECTSVRNKTRMRTDWTIFCAQCFSLLACAAGTFSRYFLLLQLIRFISRYVSEFIFFIWLLLTPLAGNSLFIVSLINSGPAWTRKPWKWQLCLINEFFLLLGRLDFRGSSTFFHATCALVVSFFKSFWSLVLIVCFFRILINKMNA
jgi:hypothetical protein